jgi:peptide chain release factor 2
MSSSNLLSDVQQQMLKKLYSNYIPGITDIYQLAKPFLSAPASCIMEIHCGAGGLDACDWSKMLYEMYTKYFNKKNWAYEICSIAYDEGGIRSAMLKVNISHILLQQESGIHKLIRISPFSKAQKRHTSFASVEVYEYTEKPSLVIAESELRWDTFRSSGAGGQHVNTTDSAVRVTHIPTGTVAQCQNQRSQLQNKQMALRILYNKLTILQTETKENSSIKMGWGNHFRTYTIYPHRVFKDNRLNIHLESNAVMNILDGNLELLIQNHIYNFLVQRINK